MTVDLRRSRRVRVCECGRIIIRDSLYGIVKRKPVCTTCIAAAMEDGPPPAACPRVKAARGRGGPNS